MHVERAVAERARAERLRPATVDTLRAVGRAQMSRRAIAAGVPWRPGVGCDAGAPVGRAITGSQPLDNDRPGLTSTRIATMPPDNGHIREIGPLKSATGGAPAGLMRERARPCCRI